MQCALCTLVQIDCGKYLRETNVRALASTNAKLLELALLATLELQ